MKTEGILPLSDFQCMSNTWGCAELKAFWSGHRLLPSWHRVYSIRDRVMRNKIKFINVSLILNYIFTQLINNIKFSFLLQYNTSLKRTLHKSNFFCSH